MGLNTIQTYIAWNYHETVPGRYFFEGQKDLVKFIELAQQQDLLVILRPGPYICAEWDYGGFPAWIYSMCKDKIRTSDATYMKLVDRWFKNLFPRLEHLLYENGGPVIAFQVENEYGSYGCDHEYMNNMVDLLKKYVPSSLLFTTDGASDGMVKCGSTNRTYTTVDFGPGGDPSHSFDVQRKFQPKGPLVNSEFYTGWLDHWGEKHHRTSADLVASSLDKILALNASVNLYMFIGGTNFNMMSGANMGGDGLQPITSSYDYDAPISEAGDPTEKYWKLQKVISKYTAMPPGPQPKPSEKLPYMKVPLASSQSLFDVVSQLPANVSKTPQPFAWLDLAQGWILYEVDISGASGNDLILDLGAFSDRASVFVDKKFQGILNAKYGSKLVIEHGQTLDLFVENEGRIGYSHAMVDASKGIKSNVTLNGSPLLNWKMWPVRLVPPEMSSTPTPFLKMLNRKIKNRNNDVTNDATWVVPSLFSFSFMLDEPKDTFLKLDQWTKGAIIINGMAQKYWTEAGPQKTLYIPSTYLQPHMKNTLIVFETDRSPTNASDFYIEFVDTPIFV
uniref:Beta-galactosidase n=1 Tax=Clytia hemisphaerica TaxID=252671 RepID=A0A7M6DLT0_9CNID